MERDQIVNVLAGIFAKSSPTSSEERKRIEILQSSLASRMLSEEVSIPEPVPSRLGQFNLSNEKKEISSIKKIVQDAAPLVEEQEMHVNLSNSNYNLESFFNVKEKGFIEKAIPDFSGIRKVKSEGPFKGNNGMDWSIDYYPYFTKLSSLYIEDQALPALLFKTKTFRFPINLPDFPFQGNLENIFGKEYVNLEKLNVREVDVRPEREPLRKVRRKNSPQIPDSHTQDSPFKKKIPFEVIERVPTNTKLYQISTNTVWVRANLLSPSAPNGHYCALRVKSGTVFLDQLPIEETQNKIKVNKTTTITINLNLEQSTSPTSVNEKFGKDANHAKYQLPTTFGFTLKDKLKNILSISDISCEVYGVTSKLKYEGSQTVEYNAMISSVTIPIKSNLAHFEIANCESELVDISGEAAIKNSYWTLFTHIIDISKPLEADSNGALAFDCEKGIAINLKNTDESIFLSEPFIFLTPQGILFLDKKSNGQGIPREVKLWKDTSKPFDTTVDIKYRKEDFLLYTCAGIGEESLTILADLRFNLDRPVKVNGEPVLINSKRSLLMFRGKLETRNISAVDPDLLIDNYLPPTPNQSQPEIVEPIAFALQNALLTVTPPWAFLLSGQYDEDFNRIFEAQLTTYFGVFKYIPTLPDPYIANIGIIDNPKDRKQPFYLDRTILRLNNITSWEEGEDVSTVFEFGDFTTSNDKPINRISSPNSESPETKTVGFQSRFNMEEPEFSYKNEAVFKNIANYSRTENNPKKLSEIIVDIVRNIFSENRFSLLDVSSNASQMGVSFKPYTPSTRRQDYMNEDSWKFPLRIDQLDVVAQGQSVQAFLLPQISWEPNFNLAEPAVSVGGVLANDPPCGFNYFPNDGYPTFVGNYSKSPVALSPIPLAEYLEEEYKIQKDKFTYAFFNLPFGMFALSILDQQSGQIKKPTIHNSAPSFKGDVNGGIQMELIAGSSLAAEGDLFQGITIQLPIVTDMQGKHGNYSTLGSSVHQIFSKEFTDPDDKSDPTRPAVPLKGIGLSGYGASIFSDWYNENATFAATSQATFKVAVGRTMHEVIQVKSVIYPWGIFVVRTITILRLSNGYIMRMDSGWQAESDGKFYYGIDRGDGPEENPYIYHAGLVNGLYNIRNIRENELVYKTTTSIVKGDFIFNPITNKEEKYESETPTTGVNVTLRGVTFDADIEIEGVVEGQDKDGRVPSKGVLGFVQLEPRGTPIKPTALSECLDFQNGSIGGPVDCSIKIAGTPQHMKIDRVDVNNSIGESDEPIFVVAVRGSVILPKEGSWTMVTHKVSDGTVTPLDTEMSVPLIRKGQWDYGKLLNEADKANLQRIAHPLEMLREPNSSTINFGLLQNLDTQKVLFLTPSFKTGIEALLSKTPPLMADGYKLLNSKGIFPDIGDALNTYGDAVPFLKGKVDGIDKNLFTQPSGVTDGVKKVYEILEIAGKEEGGKLVDQGYQLLKKGKNDVLNKLLSFDLPSNDYDLIDNENFKIIIRYKTSGNNSESKLDYNIDSFAGAMADQWRGRLNNVAMVVSLGPFDELMTVSGNFNNEKGKESNFGGSVLDNGLVTPEIKFSSAVQPVLDILQVLEELSTGDYAATLQKGLKVAMSNSANIWEYKYEATKEIGLIRFPPAPLYDAPQTPLKLEASLSIGFYFNAALKVTTDPKELLPTAGAFFMFHGGIQVMCVSIAAATIYAIGNVDLKLSADTSPQLAVDMKFGFGAQLAVGLPVVGNVSIQFMISVEMHASTGGKVAVAAMMMFRGHAEIFGGVIGVTITIEAKGIIEKETKNAPALCRASVSFGLDISVAFIINISFHETWEENRQIA